MRLARILFTAAMLCLAAFAQAGTMHPAVEQTLNEAGADEFVSVLVHMVEQAPIPQLNSELMLDRATRKHRHEVVINSLQSVTHNQDDLKSYLDTRMSDGSVEGYTGYWITNMLVVSATRAEIETITARADVYWVEMNFKVELIEPVSRPGMQQGEAGEERGDRGIGVTQALRNVRAPEVWYGLGIRGAGTLIGSMDTGVMGSHPALTSRWRGNNHPWQECWLDLLGTNTQYPVDTHGHGTHTTGTMTGVAPDDTVGMAWEGEWIACNAINQGVGSGFDNDVIAAFQWFADPDGDPGTVDDVPDVVQNSWRVYDGLGYADCFTLWYSVIDNAEAAGVVTTWSAGNEGPGASTIGSPPDRADSPTNAFSVGSVNATDYSWPFPISSFSSRGPTDCPYAPDSQIKPEVVAPGSNVYSSTNDGGFQGGWNGTSMAGPHVAGLVALMRQANPNLDVDLVKTIIMQTARDEGTAGEDNTYGWGFIDAQAAVLASMSGFGTLEGYVTNGSFGNVPLVGASVELLESGNQYWTDVAGFYSGLAAPEDYTARASMPGFASMDIPVSILVDGITSQDFALTDIAGPAISDVSEPGVTSDTVGPYPISASVTDPSTVAAVKLYYRLNQAGWAETNMTGFGGSYSGNLPGVPANTRIDYYVWAQDGVGLTAVEPFGAPNNFFTLFVTEEFYAYQVEDPEDANWTLGAPGDQATSGLWARVDPIGTVYEGTAVQPEDDHTTNPGVLCFVTGNGSVGGAAGENDVDGGCTTLLSPVFDLTGKEMAFVKYWRWFGEAGLSSDDQFEIYASDDAGATWTALEIVVNNANSWTQTVLPLHGLIDLNSQVRFRFYACDLGSGGLIEAGIDDFGIDVFSPTLSAAGDWPTQANGQSVLRQNLPNPFHPGKGVTTIQFNLGQQTNASLQVYDISGRLVRTLVDGPVAAGEQAISWNGKDDQGNTLGSGVYFYRLQAGRQVESRRLILVR